MTKVLNYETSWRMNKKQDKYISNFATNLNNQSLDLESNTAYTI